MQVTRRSFLVTAAAAAAPAFLRATDKSGSKAPILGQGDHQYEAIHDWGQLPRTIKYGNTHGVCEDSQGNIYIHHTVNAASDSADTMVVFDQQGKFLGKWTDLGVPQGIYYVKNEDVLYMCDGDNSRIIKVDWTARFWVCWVRSARFRAKLISHITSPWTARGPFMRRISATGVSTSL